MASEVVQARLEEIRIGLGIDADVFYDLTLLQLAKLRVFRDGERKGFEVVSGVKWTRAELAHIVADGDGGAALEVLQYLDERGPRVVNWTEDKRDVEGNPLEVRRLAPRPPSDRTVRGETEGEDRADQSDAR